MVSLKISNVILKRGEEGRGAHVTLHGDIQNSSGRDYTAAALRIIMRKSSNVLVNLVFTVYGLPTGRIKHFSKSLVDLDYDRVVRTETQIECQVESAF